MFFKLLNFFFILQSYVGVEDLNLITILILQNHVKTLICHVEYTWSFSTTLAVIILVWTLVFLFTLDTVITHNSTV